jgi:hypothetical protein
MDNLDNLQQLYIVKTQAGYCEIITEEKLKEDPNIVKRWGPFLSPGDAIASGLSNS